jgi:hypothetical protein
MEMVLHSYIIGIGIGNGSTDAHQVWLAPPVLSRYPPSVGLSPRRPIPAWRGPWAASRPDGTEAITTLTEMVGRSER